MKMLDLKAKSQKALNDASYERRDAQLAIETLDRLEIGNDEIRLFYESYEGSFGSDFISHELLDLCDGYHTVETATIACRQAHGFPKNFIALTELSSAGKILVTDSLTSSVYEVDFEGGQLLLLSGEIEARWPNFINFLNEYFGGPE